MSLPKTIEWCRQLAEARGGRCLATEYKNNATKYFWECAEGHKWGATAGNIRQGKWCPVCSGNVLKSLQWLQELAAERGGKCLSTKYKNNVTKYPWECAKGHRWEAKANDVQHGSWCPHCAGLAPKNLQWLQELAAQKSGKCLATKYQSTKTKYLWECKERHRWEAQATSIRQGQWCPHCSHQTSKPEVQLLKFVQQFCPDAQKGKGVLKNKRYELDIYIPSLHKAIEFDGEFWHYSEWAAKHGAPRRDARKNQQCSEADIQLLRVRERDYLANPEVVKQQILDFLKSQS